MGLVRSSYNVEAASIFLCFEHHDVAETSRAFAITGPSEQIFSIEWVHNDLLEIVDIKMPTATDGRQWAFTFAVEHGALRGFDVQPD
ncbi:hypothetical protein IP81_05285 [Novosphingobium sp. AAP83]|nr:hypothetical protein IP81_05285 [Novosphingobium sp. AAP83]